MYCYKLNDSYTTYVDYTYLNDCVKACKGKHAPVKKTSGSGKGPCVVPVALNACVRHKSRGIGKVVAKEDSGVLTVAFRDGEARFMYPIAFRRGTLVMA